MTKSRKILWLVAFVGLVLAGRPALAGDVARAQMDPLQVQWEPQVDFERMVLTVSTPGGTVVRREFTAGQTPVFDLAREGAADGSYTWELRVTPSIDPGVRRQLAAAHQRGETAGQVRAAGPLVQSGSFMVANGTIVRQDVPEQRGPRVQTGRQVTPVTAADQVIPDDLIVQGSECVGLDCVNNESFGFDTIRLKENNTRIKFEDTSVGSFPTNDWQLTANDSASGASSKFSIEDITGSRVPFTVTAGAATNSIFVDSTGRLGLRTSTPVLDLHINTSNTPSIRLEQNNSGGFTAQTWDIGANEANFFVRDVTGGSKLSFRIRPGAPTSSLDISSDGDVGIGTASPGNKLHVLGAAGTNTAVALIQESSGTTAAREVLELRNNGGSILILEDTSVAQRWSFGTSGSSFVIDEQAHAGAELTLTNTGNLTVLGTVNGVSDRNMKKEIFPVRRDEILSKLDALPISTWSFKTEDIRHMGPMAQDFSAAFGLGMDDKHIAYTDLAGVTMAAVQALHQEVTAKDAEITDLKSRIETLEKLVQGLAQPQATAKP